MAKRKRTVSTGEMTAIHEMPRRFRLNGSQELALEAINNHAVSVLIGNAGTGKSFVALYAAREFLQTGAVEKVIVVRSPLEIARARIGFLPGEIDLKMAPWAAASKAIAKELGIEPSVEFLPLGFIQGMTFRHAMVIVEECQSLTLAEFEAVVTRLGVGSTMVMTGDPHQDIARSGGLGPFIRAVESVNGVAIVRFNPADNQRHPIVRDICQALWGEA
jgi:phosphate starvation-inducible PhoH-like protein